jgi:hypothetical protein
LNVRVASAPKLNLFYFISRKWWHTMMVLMAKPKGLMTKRSRLRQANFSVWIVYYMLYFAWSKRSFSRAF